MLTTINIGLDVLKNLEILHTQGYVHRDLKPNNLAFDSLSRRNYKNKLNIGILDFGSSCTLEKQEKKYLIKGKKFFRYGKRIYASNNVLYGRPCLTVDDVISLFYILIKLYKGTLPWIINNNEKSIDIGTIKNIRQKYRTYILCEGFPIKFRKEFDILLKLPQDECPDYKSI